MPRRSAKFTTQDVKRFVKGLQDAGVKPARYGYDLEGGRLIAFVDGPALDDDAELAEFRRKNGYS